MISRHAAAYAFKSVVRSATLTFAAVTVNGYHDHVRLLLPHVVRCRFLL